MKLDDLVRGKISSRLREVSFAITTGVPLDAATCTIYTIADDIDEAVRELLVAAIGDGDAVVLPRDEVKDESAK